MIQMPPPGAGLSFLEWTLLLAIGTALLGCGALITYAVKTVLPRIVGAFEAALERQTKALESIPGAITQLKVEVVASEGRIADRISSLGADLGNKIQDRQLADLEETIRSAHLNAGPEAPTSTRRGA